MELVYDWAQISKRHLVCFLPGAAFHQAVNQLFSPAGFEYQGTTSLKPLFFFFFEKPGFHSREKAAENTVSLVDGGEAIAFILRYPLSLFSCKTGT